MSDPPAERPPDTSPLVEVGDTAKGGGTTASREDLTGRDRLARNVLVSWAGHAVFVISGFIMPRLIDRNLGQEVLGTWDFAWSLVAYFSLVQAGIGSSVNRYVAKYRNAGNIAGVNRAVSSVWCFLMVGAAVVLALSIAASLSLPALFGHRLTTALPDAQRAVFLMGTGMAIQIGFAAFSGVVSGCHRWDLHNIITGGSRAVTVAGMIVSLTLGGGLVSLALISSLGQAIDAALHLPAAYRVCPGLRLRPGLATRKQFRGMFLFGGKTLVPSVGNLLLNQTVSILIVSHLGPMALAVYARPQALIRHLQTLIAKLSHVLTPTAGALAGATRTADLRALFISATRYTLYTILPATLILVIFGDVILGVWMGPRYQNGTVLTILVLGFLPTIAHMPATNILAGVNAHGRPGIAYAAATVVAVILASIALGPLKLGLAGVAVSVAAPLAAVNGIYLPVYACRTLELPIGKYALKALRGPMLCCLPFGLFLVGFRALLQDNLRVAALWGVGLGSTLLVILYWRYVLPKRTRAAACRVARIDRIASLWSRPMTIGVRHAIGKMTFQLLCCLQFTRLYRYIHRNSVIILMIHGVMHNDGSAAWEPLRPQLSPAKLAKYMAALSKHYRFVSLDDAIDMLNGEKPMQPYSLALTFDDGYRNSITHAMPVLRRYGAPATVFLATEFLEQPRPYWVDRLDYALQQAPPIDREVTIGDQTFRFDARRRETLQAFYRRFRNAAKGIDRPDAEFVREMEELAAELEANSGKALSNVLSSDDWAAVLTWDEVAAAGDDVSFESHTVDHVRLGYVDEHVAHHQLAASKARIETHTNVPCTGICYPDGSFNEDAVRLASECGYTHGVTTVPGLNRKGSDTMRLHRFDLPTDGNVPKFLATLCQCTRASRARKPSATGFAMHKTPELQSQASGASTRSEPLPWDPQ